MESTRKHRLLADEHVAMIDKGVSVIAGSRDRSNRPSLMRACGSQLSADASSVTIFVARSQSAQLLADVAATGRIAVVFSQPHTHRTLQIKSSRVRFRDCTPQDQPTLERYLLSMEDELGRIGYPRAFVHALLFHPLEDLLAITLDIEQAFDQTPGPRAGAALVNSGEGSAP